MNHIEKEKLIKADITSIENRVRHAFNQGYDLGYKEGKANCSEIPTGSTTKNHLSEEDILELKHRYGDEVEFVVRDMLTDEGKRWDKLPSIEPIAKKDLPHCQHMDKEIAKSFIEDVEAVKDQLPCEEQMDFPSTFDEFAKDYGFKDKDEVYTNGAELISVFRVKQWLEHISTTKNDLGVDCISRAQTQTEIEMIASRYTIAKERGGMGQVEWSDQLIKVSDAVDIIRHLPSVTPQEPKTGHWIVQPSNKEQGERDFIWWKCSECGQVIYSETEKDRKEFHAFCGRCGAKMVEPQESENP